MYVDVGHVDHADHEEGLVNHADDRKGQGYLSCGASAGAGAGHGPGEAVLVHIPEDRNFLGGSLERVWRACY